MNANIALVGNPNCGKTTLFNALTGSHQKIGNWTGVTVQEKVGAYKKDKNIKIIDLPGVYSLNSDAVDERVASDYLKNKRPNVIINVVDGTNLERNLFLTTDLCVLGVPMVIAVNMYDELEKNNIKFNSEKLSNVFGVPVICVSALKNKNVDELINLAIKRAITPKTAFFTGKTASVGIEGRYEFIEKVANAVLTRKNTKSEIITQRIDGLLMHRYLGIPIFFTVMFLVYFLSMKIGGGIGGVFSTQIHNFGENLAIKLNYNRVGEWLVSLVCDAVIGALGGVTSFLPQILILFFLMAIIEQSGYASRVAFLLDRVFRSFGLGGKSLLPLIVSCGCTVTGIMSTRTIERVNERRMTVFLSPFMPCGAKTAVFAWFSSTIFGGNALVATSMYFLGIICVGVFGKILSGFKPFRENDGGFMMEIPTLRIPALKDVFFVLIEKVKEFITKAGLIVFCVSIFLWLFKSIGVSGYVGQDIEKSFLFTVGNCLKYIFYPFGVNSWEASVALISGAFAKESIVETLNLITSDVNAVFSTKYSAYAFMAFVLLSPPCVGSLVVAKQELGSVKWFIFMLIFQTLTAYAVAITINALGNLITYYKGLILSIILGIILIAGLIFSLKKLKLLKRKGCGFCATCQGEIKCRKEERSTI